MKEETPQQPVCDVGLTTEHNTEVCYHAGRPECHKCSRPIGGLEEDSAPKESEPAQWEKDFRERYEDTAEEGDGLDSLVADFKSWHKQQLEKLIDDIDNYDVLYRESKRDMEYLKAKLRKELLKETND